MKGCGTFRDFPSLPTRKISAKLAAFGRELHDLRKRHDLGALEIARFLDASPVKMSNLERGAETDPDFKWCPACKGQEEVWRSCKHCSGIGYVRKESER